MLDTELISVIIPTYNRGSFIARTVQSVFDQTWKDIEVIVVDDGSTDNTRTILAPFLDHKGFRYLRQDNKGRSVARNEGCKIATGKWIMYLDSDDWLNKDAIETLYNLSLESSESDIVFANFNFTDSKRGAYSHNWIFNKKGIDQQVLMQVFSCDLWLTKTGTYLIKKELAEKIGGFNPSFEPSEDLDFSLKALTVSKASYSQETVLHVERHPGNTDETEIQDAIVRICRYYETASKTWGDKFNEADRLRALSILRYRIANGSYEIDKHGLALRYYVKLLFIKPGIIFDKFIFKQIFASMLPPVVKRKWKNGRSKNTMS